MIERGSISIYAGECRGCGHTIERRIVWPPATSPREGLHIRCDECNTPNWTVIEEDREKRVSGRHTEWVVQPGEADCLFPGGETA